jgi:hypothetical protein
MHPSDGILLKLVELSGHVIEKMLPKFAPVKAIIELFLLSFWLIAETFNFVHAKVKLWPCTMVDLTSRIGWNNLLSFLE